MARTTTACRSPGRPSRADRRAWPRSLDRKSRMAVRATRARRLGVASWCGPRAWPCSFGTHRGWWFARRELEGLARRSLPPLEKPATLCPRAIFEEVPPASLTVPQMSCPAKPGQIDLGVSVLVRWVSENGPDGVARSSTRARHSGTASGPFPWRDSAVRAPRRWRALRRDGGPFDVTSKAWHRVALRPASKVSQYGPPGDGAPLDVTSKAWHRVQTLKEKLRMRGSSSRRDAPSSNANGTPDELPGEAGSDRSGC